MNKEAMKQQIMEALSKKLGDDFQLSIQKYFKNNLELDGLSIKKTGESIVPIIYLDPLYQDLENDSYSVEKATERIILLYFNALPQTGSWNIESLLDFDYAKSRLYLQLINRNLNEELLHEIPHTLFLDDFAITVRCLVSEDDGASFLIHNGHLKHWGINQEILFSTASHNTREVFGVELMRLEDVITQVIPDTDIEKVPSIPIWLMTNKRQCSGAAVCVYDDTLKDFARNHGSFCVIFSSIHEVLLLPEFDISDTERLTKMNLEVNATQVEPNEILGTKAYFYDKDKGFVLSAGNSL